jgi:hypothetical protein
MLLIKILKSNDELHLSIDAAVLKAKMRDDMGTWHRFDMMRTTWRKINGMAGTNGLGYCPIGFELRRFAVQSQV